MNPALQEMVQDHLPVGFQVGHVNPMNLGMPSRSTNTAKANAAKRTERRNVARLK